MSSADGDVARAETMARFSPQDVAHVFHLAGKTFVPDSWNEPQVFCQTNVLGTVNVLEFCRKNSIPITYVSAYVYGHPDSLPISEGCAIRPSNPYALTKRLAEDACEFYANIYDLPVTTIRPFNAYGIGQPKNFLIPLIVKQALGPGGVIAVKDLAPRRDYVYVEDLVTALVTTLDRPDGYRVYNIGSGVSLSVQEVIDAVQAIAGTQKKVVSENVARTNELMDVVADISKAGKELGWHPGFSFRAGIEAVIDAERSRMLL
jgi:nucleoside-diphosphate-sugar epimerase